MINSERRYRVLRLIIGGTLTATSLFLAPGVLSRHVLAASGQDASASTSTAQSTVSGSSVPITSGSSAGQKTTSTPGQPDQPAIAAVQSANAGGSSTFTSASEPNQGSSISALNIHSNYTSPLNPGGTNESNYQFTKNDIVETGSNETTHYLKMPSALPEALASQWLEFAKAQADADAATTGRSQQIVQVAASPAVERIALGNALYPRVDTVDIASYQSWMTQSDFNRLKSLGVKAVIVKLTEGSGYVNPYAAQEISRAQNAGLQVAVYHFATFSSASGAVAEANNFISTIRRFGLSANTPVVADMEASSLVNDVTGNLKAFWAQLSNAGYSNHVVYTGKYYSFSSGVIGTVGADRAWIAQYPYSPRASNLINTQYGAWQFSSTAYIPGGSTSQSIDVSIDYQGLFSGANYDRISSKTSKQMTGTINCSNSAGLFLGGPYNTNNQSSAIADFARNYNGQQVQITAEAVTPRATWFQITLSNGKTYWVDRSEISVRYDAMTQTTNENYAATLAGSNRNDGLFAGGPYMTSRATENVAAYSSILAGQTFKVIKQTTTRLATWVQIQLSNGQTYWINKQGVQQLSYDAVSNRQSVDAVYQISEGGRDDGLFIDGPYMTSINSIEVAQSAQKFDGQIVHLISTATTVKGSWAQIQLNNGQTYWLNRLALKALPLDNVLSHTSESLSGNITENGRDDGMFVGGPYYTSWQSLTPAASGRAYDGQPVSILGFDTTPRATWAHIRLSSGSEYWINAQALTIRDDYDPILNQSVQAGVGLIHGATARDGLFVGGPYNTSAGTSAPVGSAASYQNQFVTVLAKATTRRATWIQIRTQDGQTYWVDSKLVQFQSADAVLSSFSGTGATAQIDESNRNDGLFVGGPYHTSANTFSVAASARTYNGQTVRISAMQQTTRALWAEITTPDGHTYWIDSRALKQPNGYDAILNQTTEHSAGTVSGAGPLDGLFLGGPYATSQQSGQVAASAVTLNGQYVTIIGSAMTTRGKWLEITVGGNTYWLSARLIRTTN